MKKNKKKSKFLSDFKEFISKGNVIDMAVGVVIGGAFSKIISSLVADIITPLISLVLGKGTFTALVFTLREAQLDDTGEVVRDAVTINIGNFINNVIDFLIIAFCIFMALRYLMKMKNMFAAAGNKLKEIVEKEDPALAEKVEEIAQPAEPVPPVPTEEEKTREVLSDIRTLLQEIKEQK